MCFCKTCKIVLKKQSAQFPCMLLTCINSGARSDSADRAIQQRWAQGEVCCWITRAWRWGTRMCDGLLIAAGSSKVGRSHKHILMWYRLSAWVVFDTKNWAHNRFSYEPSSAILTWNEPERVLEHKAKLQLGFITLSNAIYFNRSRGSSS